MSFKEIPQETCLDTKYEFMGTVTISCEEYRDLIRTVAELKAIAVEEHDDYINTRIELREAREEIGDLRTDLDFANNELAHLRSQLKEVE